MFDEADEYPTLLVQMVECKASSVVGKVVELNLGVVATEADIREKAEEQERREENRVYLEDEEVENEVVGGALKAYTAGKGIKLQGKIHYLEEAAFKKAFIDSEIQERLKENARGTMTKWTEQALIFYLSARPTGFRDGEDIYVRADRQGFGTEIHEAIHRYSSRNVVENIGFNFNEGLTEYFTRIVTADRIERGDEYYYQLLLVELLVDKSILSVADLGDMYFNGAADRLLTQLTAKLDPSFRYSAFISLVNTDKVADAMAYVRNKASASSEPTEVEASAKSEQKEKSEEVDLDKILESLNEHIAADKPEETGEKEDKKAMSDEDDLEKMLALLHEQIAVDEQDTDEDEKQEASEDVDVDLLWTSVETKLGAHEESLKNWLEYGAERRHRGRVQGARHRAGGDRGGSRSSRRPCT